MQTYLKKEHAPAPRAPTAARTPQDAPSMDTLRAGTAQPSPEQLGQRVDLPSQIQAKMEQAFGMDFSGVRLYRSQAVADAGAQAVAQGGRIAFAPDQLDFSSRQGQALLGHELSHVASQARGEARGQGFLANAALEARADQEGAMAARGESVGPATGTLSSASAVSAAGPMQAKKPDKDKREQNPAAPAAAAQAPQQPTQQDQEFQERAEQSDYNPLEETYLPPVESFNDLSENLSDTFEVLSEQAPSQRTRNWAKNAGDSRGMDILNKTASITGTGAAGYGLAKSVSALASGEGDRVDAAAEVAENAGETAASAAETADAFLPESAADAVKDSVGRAAGGGKMAAGIVKGMNSGRHFARAVAGKEDGDHVDQAMEAVSDMSESAGSVVEGMNDAGLLGDTVATKAGSGLLMATGGVGAARAARKYSRANTDIRLAQNTLSKVRAGTANRAGDEQRQNDELLDQVLSAQQRSGRVNKRRSVTEGIHSGLDVVKGGVSMIPTGGELAALGFGAVQKATDFVGSEVSEHAIKRAREENLGQEHMDLQRQLMDRLIQEKLAATGKRSRSELTAYELDQCRTQAKHTVNEHLYGKGVRTNRMAGMQQTKQQMDSMQALMSSNTDEGTRAAEFMRNSGHDVDEHGNFANQNETQARLNADLSSSESFDETWSGAVSHEDAKLHPVLVAKAQAAARHKKWEGFKTKVGAGFDRFKQWSSLSMADKWAHAKQGAQQGWNTLKTKAGEKWTGLKEGGRRTLGKIKEWGALSAADKWAHAKQGAKNAWEKVSNWFVDPARRQAKAQYKADENQYVEQKLQEEGGNDLGFFKKQWKKHQLKKEFRRKNEEEGGARKIENAVEGSASAGHTNFFKRKYLHARRSHDRMRDSMVNDGWDQLGKWDRFKLAASNPLAWIASKTESGRKKSELNANAASSEHSAELLRSIMSGAGPAPAQPASQDSTDPSDPSTLSFKDKIRHLNSQQAGPAGGELIDQTADPALLSVKDKVERYDTGTASNDGVDPALLPFKNKVKHLNSRLGGK